jgi:hypothetical protein
LQKKRKNLRATSFTTGFCAFGGRLQNANRHSSVRNAALQFIYKNIKKLFRNGFHDLFLSFWQPPKKSNLRGPVGIAALQLILHKNREIFARLRSRPGSELLAAAQHHLTFVLPWGASHFDGFRKKKRKFCL